MKNDLLEALSSITGTQFALESVRANEVARALEILELELDAKILKLHTLAESADPPERERVVSTLRQIRAYRQANPRRVESDLATVANGVVARSVQASENRVREILDEVQ
jgi:hypothetical protein